MERGKELLRARNLSVKEIAQELGYSRQHEFSRAFRNCFGVSPSEWRRRGPGDPDHGAREYQGRRSNGGRICPFDQNWPSEAATTVSKTAKDNLRCSKLLSSTCNT
jgi:hypothetical protein